MCKRYRMKIILLLLLGDIFIGLFLIIQQNVHYLCEMGNDLEQNISINAL